LSFLRNYALCTSCLKIYDTQLAAEMIMTLFFTASPAGLNLVFLSICKN